MTRPDAAGGPQGQAPSCGANLCRSYPKRMLRSGCRQPGSAGRLRRGSSWVRAPRKPSPGGVMRLIRAGAVVSAAAATVSAIALSVPGALAAAPAAKVQLRNSESPAASRTPRTGAAPGGSPMAFAVDLKLPEPGRRRRVRHRGVNARKRPVSRYLTAAQWEARFSPTRASSPGVAFLRSRSHPRRRPGRPHEVPAHGTAAQVERPSGPRSRSTRDRVIGGPRRPPWRPRAVAGFVAGDGRKRSSQQRRWSRARARTPPAGSPTARTALPPPSRAPRRRIAADPPPPGFRVAQPCGEVLQPEDRHDAAALRQRLSRQPPWAVCGYDAVAAPQRLQPHGGLRRRRGHGGDRRRLRVADAALRRAAVRVAQRSRPPAALVAVQRDRCRARYNQGRRVRRQRVVRRADARRRGRARTAPGAKIVYAGARNCLQGTQRGGAQDRRRPSGRRDHQLLR